MKMNTFFAFVIAALLSSVAYAQSSGFDQLDTNGDGSLDASELSSAGIGSDQVQAMDANGDGKVSKDEYESSMGGGGTSE